MVGETTLGPRHSTAVQTLPELRLQLLKNINNWAIGEDGDESYRDYFVAGEALDWKALANRIAITNVPVGELPNIASWLYNSDHTGGIEEEEFKALVGEEKHALHLNYFYGVLVERSLITMETEHILKGKLRNDAASIEQAGELAYINIYRATRQDLLEKFKLLKQIESGEWLSLTQVKEFTYFLFKHRVGNSLPAKTASDTKRGLTFLVSMRRAQSRRINPPPKNDFE